MSRWLPLLVVLVLQACLSFFALDLLPVWADEHFTMTLARKAPGEIAAAVRQDIHPPLYYVLLHAWRTLPLPWGEIAGLRAFSVCWALLATVLLDVFWLRQGTPVARWAGLLLFAGSPCLLLYGRMARSYSMQVGLSILLAGLALRWFEKPGSKGRAAGVWAAALALLYTHYVPGIALLAGVMVAGWRVVGVARLAGLLACAGAGYLPWGMGLWEAATRWGGAAGFSSQYTLTGNLLGEQLLKLGFGLVSLSLGESFAVVSLLLAPVVLLLAWRGFRAGGFPGSFLLLVGSAAVVGYLGVARWVSYPFIPGRMLWTLPFLCLGVAAGLAGLAPGRWRTACGAALALSAVVSTIHYYQREGFLNPGYTVPLQAIAARLNAGASAHGLILFDSYNTDYHAIVPWLSGRTPHVLLTPGNRREVMSRAGAAAEVWIVRNTRDASPGGTTGEVAAAVCAGRRVREELYQPYAGWQRAVLRWAGFQPGLTHFYRVERCSASEPVR